MKRWHLLTLMLILFAVGIVPAAAQDTPFALGDGYSITIPDGYEITLDPDGFYILENRDSEIWVFTPTQLQAYIPHTQSAGAETIVADLAELTETELTSVIVPLDIADRTGASADWSDGVMIAVEMSDLFYGVIWPAGTFSDADLETLVGSFDGEFSEDAPSELDEDEPANTDGGKGAVSIGDGSGSGSTDTDITPTVEPAAPEESVTSTGEACTVSTDTRDSARLRVGPGETRGVIAFLPVNADVDVTGRFEEDDGDVWYQLDKEQAMPGTSANELWVSADEVDTVGDCDTVGDASAPPVIPGGIVQPPATGGEGSPDSSGGTEIVGGAVPLTGTWTVNWNPTTNASCQGGGNVPIPSTEFLDDLNYPTYLSVRGDGSSFTNGGDVYTRTGPNSYYGTFTFDNGENSQLYFNVVNSRSVNGSATGNFDIDGTPCSFTTTFVGTYGG